MKRAEPGTPVDKRSEAGGEDMRMLVEEASKVLGSSLDIEATLAGMAGVAVPGFADWCVIDLLAEDGGVRRVRVATAGPEYELMAGAAGLDRPPDLSDPACPVGRVLRSGTALLAAEVPPASRKRGHPFGHMRLKAYIVAPLVAHGQTLGAISLLAGADSGKAYGEEELALALEIARKSALAIDNARLHLEVARQRDQLGVILDGVADSITAQDGNGALLYANRSATKSSGYPFPELAICAPLSAMEERFSLYDASGKPFAFDDLPGRRALRGRSGRPVSLRIVDRRTGETRWAALQATPILDSGGQVDMVINIMHDLTEDKRAQAALRASQDRTRTILETMPVSLWEEDFSAVKAELDALKAAGVSDIRSYIAEHPEFVAHTAGLVRVLDVNQAALRMMEAESKSALLGSLQRIFVPESAPAFAEELVAIAEGRSSFSCEAAIVTLAGRPRDVVISMTLPSGGLNSVLVSIMDITERKEAELAVRRSEERYRTLVTASTSIVWTAAADGAIIGDVPAWEAFTGQRPAEYLGWGWLNALYREDRVASERTWRKIVKRKTPITRVFRVTRRDGQIRRMVVKAVPVFDETGRVAEWIGTCTDVEDHKRFREEQRRRELEEILAAHSAREKRRIARELHDGVRQQLVGIRMLAANLHKKMAERGLPEAELMDEFARLVGDANTQVRELISDMAPAQVEADGLLPALKRAAQNLEQWYGLSCTVRAAKTARPSTDESADHLFYIAQEAMTNAAKHGKASHVHVALSREGGTLKLEVEDDGAGLPEDFDKRGGMGVANMRHRAELVGGRLELHGGEGRTTVVCHVPA